MTFDFEQFGFTLETTLDGSPTLRLMKRLTDGLPNSEKPPESMHHSGGAAKETLYVYIDPLTKALDLAKSKSIPLDQLKTCVVGLGLGYIEMGWAKAHQQVGSIGSCDSFEVVDGLKQSFQYWLQNPEDSSIYSKCLKHMNIHSIETIMKALQHNYSKEEHFYKDLLETEYYKNKKWNFICYDAFSRKTNEQLWSEEFLTNWIKSYTENDAIFATYACTGALKRALENNNFTFIKRPGFQGKRDATLALRGIYKDLFLNLFT